MPRPICAAIVSVIAVLAIAPTVSAQPIAPLPDGVTFTTFTAGERFTCALASDQRAYCWGRNHVGQLGIGAMVGRCDASIFALGDCARVPAAVAGDHRFTAISAGDSHTCGIDETGAVYCWGESHLAADGSTQQCRWETSRDTMMLPCNRTPALVPLPAPVVSIGAGDQRTCAVDATGATWCWIMHRLRPKPERIDIEPLTSIDLGGDYACGLTTDAGIRCWTTMMGQDEVAKHVGDGETWTAITVGAKHGCALNTEGRAFCWGSDADGALGIGPNDHVKWNDVELRPVDTDRRFTSIVTGTMRTCAIDSAGALHCWGRVPEGPADDDCLDSNGVPGTDENDCTTRPVWVHHNRRFVHVAIGDRHQCGISALGAAYCWGQNQSGELGDGTLRGIDAPVAVRRGGVTFSDVRWLDARELIWTVMVSGGLGVLVFAGLWVSAGSWIASRTLLQLALAGIAAFVVMKLLGASESFATNRGFGGAVRLVALQPLVIVAGMLALRFASWSQTWWRSGRRIDSTIPLPAPNIQGAGTKSIFLVVSGWVLFGLVMMPNDSPTSRGGGDVALGLAMLFILSTASAALFLAGLGGLLALFTLRRDPSATAARVGLVLAALTLMGGAVAAGWLFWPTER